MEQLIYAHPNENIAYSVIGVTVRNNNQGGSVKCVVCGKVAPWWELEYTPI